MLNYFKESFARKKARRVFQEYGTHNDTFLLKDEGEVHFANWDNPLMHPKTLTQDEIDFYKKSVTIGSMALDIGANIGDTTVPMAIAAGKEGLIIALEPNPVVFKVLKANSDLNKDKTHIIALPFAASDGEENFYYKSSEASFSNGGLTKDKESLNFGKYTYPDTVKSIDFEKYLNDNHKDKLSSLSL